MAGRLTIANTNGGSLSAEFVLSLVNTKEADPSVEYLQVQGPYLVDSRNRLAAEFLDSGREWLLLIDSDMEWWPEQIPVLLAEERPVVSALYYATLGPGGIMPTPVAWDLDGGQVEPGRGLVECRALGAGFLLIRRYVLAQVVSVYGRAFECEYRDGQMVSEDFVFCERVRALGESVYVHSGVVVGHAKKVVLRPLLGEVLIEERARLAEVVG